MNKNYAENIWEPQFIGKQFDLKVGDIVKAKELEIGTGAKYEVIGIYENLFRCKKITGEGRWLIAFTKSDYTTGAVVKA